MASSSRSQALVVGGTGPSGRHIVEGLLSRGYAVTIAHTGSHEVDSWSARVEHIHVDPFDSVGLSASLDGQTFDLAFAMYGRLAETARILRGSVGRLVGVGAFVAYRGIIPTDPRHWPTGPKVPLREFDELASPVEGFGGTDRKLAHVVQAEQAVFDNHPSATHLRFSLMYGPFHPAPWIEWSIVKRILDKRPAIIVPDGGLSVRTRAYTRNAADAALLVVDHLDDTAGKVYNVADEWTPTVRQWIEIIARALDYDIEIVEMPWALATPSYPMMFLGDSGHRVTLSDRAIYELGYRDSVPVEEALAATVRWLADHQPGPDEPLTRSDPRNYEAEDGLLREWRNAMSTLMPLARAADPGFVPRYSGSYQIVHPRRGRWSTLRTPDDQ